MAAWNHSMQFGWDDRTIHAYRFNVGIVAPNHRGDSEDCADLSMKFLINFAFMNGLGVSLRNQDGWVYSSRSDMAAPYSMNAVDSRNNSATWSNRDEFYAAVKRHINVRDLWQLNTTKNPFGPSPGDLLIIYKKTGIFASRHHAGIVCATFAAGKPHPRAKDTSIPDYPGGDKAMDQKNVTEYFRGTTADHDEGSELSSRLPDENVHFDYLNSRGDAKRNAELILFANAKDFQGYGFEFRIYSDTVFDGRVHDDIRDRVQKGGTAV